MEDIFLHRRGSSDGNFPRRILVTCAAALLLSMLYYTIFHFSAQDAEQSGSLSLKVSYKGAEIVNCIWGGRWGDSLEELALFLEHPVRKMAHFSEYACMGAADPGDGLGAFVRRCRRVSPVFCPGAVCQCGRRAA